jgi:hypothetical protein
VLTPDDRIDDALKSLARVEASRGFAGQVRSRMEAGAGSPGRWPRAALACAAVLVVAVTAMWLMRAPAVAPAPSVTAARATPEPAAAPVVPRDPMPSSEPITPAATSRGVRTASSPRRGAQDGIATDHERALAPLASIDALEAEPIAPAALVMADQPIAPLTPIAPLDVADDIGGADR